MLNQLFTILSVRVAGIIAAFCFLAFVSRILSPSELGGFLFAATTVTLLHFVALCGTNIEVIRIGVPFWRAKNFQAFRRLALTGTGLVVVGCSIISPGLFLLYLYWPNQVAVSISGYPVEVLVLIVVIALLLFSLRTLFADLVRSAGRYRLSMASLSLIPNTASFLFLFALWISEEENIELWVFGAWVCGLFITLVALILALPIINFDKIGRAPNETSGPGMLNLFRSGAPIMFSQLLYQLAWHGGVWYVGYFFMGADIALYAICLRLAELVALPGVIVPFFGQPIIAANLPDNEGRQLSEVMQTLTTLALAPSLFLLFIFWLFGELILHVLFGPTYVDGAFLLFLVAGGRCADIIAGSAAQSVLLISGNWRAVLLINAATLAFFAGMLPICTSAFDLNGVGIALVVYFAVRSVSLAVAAVSSTRIATWPTISVSRVQNAMHYYQGL